MQFKSLLARCCYCCRRKKQFCEVHLHFSWIKSFSFGGKTNFRFQWERFRSPLTECCQLDTSALAWIPEFVRWNYIGNVLAVYRNRGRWQWSSATAVEAFVGHSFKVRFDLIGMSIAWRFQNRFWMYKNMMKSFTFCRSNAHGTVSRSVDTLQILQGTNTNTMRSHHGDKQVYWPCWIRKLSWHWIRAS